MIPSGDGSGSPHNVSMAIPKRSGFSANGTKVKDHAWIGYAFASRRRSERIRVDQTTIRVSPGLVRSRRASTAARGWIVAAGDIPVLRGGTGWIDLPASEPARLWASLPQGQRERGRRGLDSDRARHSRLDSGRSTSALVPADLSSLRHCKRRWSGVPPAASMGTRTPFGFRLERATAVKAALDRYAFAATAAGPAHSRRPNRQSGFRQDLVRVEKSSDGGVGDGHARTLRLSGSDDWIYSRRASRPASAPLWRRGDMRHRRSMPGRRSESPSSSLRAKASAADGRSNASSPRWCCGQLYT